MRPNSRFYFNPYPYADTYEGYLNLTEYSINSRTVLQLFYYDSEYDTYLPYARLTVNIPSVQISDNNSVFIDINNNPYALNLLINELKCARLTGHVAQSGRCYYPEVRLIADELLKYINLKED